MLLGIGTELFAQEATSPTQFTLGILAEHEFSFVLPSAPVVNERGKLGGVTLIVTNYTEQEQGFVFDRLRVMEVMKLGETKTVNLSAIDLDAIGSEQSGSPYYNRFDKAHIGGLLYIKRRDFVSVARRCTLPEAPRHGGHRTSSP
ncbi:MAG: hypothetical protein ABI856_02345 [Nitrospira sp.]